MGLGRLHNFYPDFLQSWLLEMIEPEGGMQKGQDEALPW